MVDSVSVRFKNARVEKMPLNIPNRYSEGRGSLQEGRLGVPGVLPDIFRTAIFPRNFPRKWRKRRREPELPDLAWKLPDVLLPDIRDLPSYICIQRNAGTACVSEGLLKTLACRGLRVGPSKERGGVGGG